MDGLLNAPIPDHTSSLPHPPIWGVVKSPLQIAAKRLEIDENANGARLIRHFLSMNLYHEQSFESSFSPKPKNSIRRRSNIITCAVVERPDHHCGDDLFHTPQIILHITQLMYSAQSDTEKLEISKIRMTC